MAITDPLLAAARGRVDALAFRALSDEDLERALVTLDEQVGHAPTPGAWANATARLEVAQTERATRAAARVDEHGVAWDRDRFGRWSRAASSRTLPAGDVRPGDVLASVGFVREHRARAGWVTLVGDLDAITVRRDATCIATVLAARASSLA